MNTRRQLRYLRIAIRVVREKVKKSEAEVIIESLESLERRLEAALEREAKNG